MSKKFFSIEQQKKYLMHTPKKRIAAAMIILNSKNELLLLKRTYKDRWALPGGVVEKDESPLDGCIREVIEEIGLKLSPKLLLFTRYVKKPELNDELIGMYFYYGKISSRKIQSIKLDEDEIEKFDFVKLKEISKYNKSLATIINKHETDFINGKAFGYLESKHEKVF